MEPTQIAIFKKKEIRKTLHNGEWWFSVIDVVQALTDQLDDYAARKYWNKLAQRLRDEESEAVTNCHRLKLLASDGKMRETDCADTEGMFRIIQLPVESSHDENESFWPACWLADNWFSGNSRPPGHHLVAFSFSRAPRSGALLIRRFRGRILTWTNTCALR